MLILASQPASQPASTIINPSPFSSHIIVITYDDGEIEM
jgi:hypothetical protein